MNESVKVDLDECTSVVIKCKPWMSVVIQIDDSTCEVLERLDNKWFIDVPESKSFKKHLVCVDKDNDYYSTLTMALCEVMAAYKGQRGKETIYQHLIALSRLAC